METPDLKASVLPQFFPAHWLAEASDLVFSAFPSRIRVGYVVRGEGAYTFVTQEQLQDAGMSLPDVHAAALVNLRGLPMPDLKVAATPGGPEAYLGEASDNFVAARLLLPNVQQVFRKELGERFLAAIPCRDWFICWSESQVAEWQSKNFAEARSIFLSDPYNLTPDILQVSGAEFTLYREQVCDA